MLSASPRFISWCSPPRCWGSCCLSIGRAPISSSRQTEATLDAEITGLAEQYAQRGLSGLIQIVAARSAGDRGDAMVYLVTDPDGKPLAGNIAAWPTGVPTHSAWLSFALERNVNGRLEHPSRARPALHHSRWLPLAGRPRHQRCGGIPQPGPIDPAVGRVDRARRRSGRRHGDRAATCCAASSR